jgi:hypothetical protein
MRQAGGKQTYNVTRNAVLGAEASPDRCPDGRVGMGSICVDGVGGGTCVGGCDVAIACGVESMSSNLIGYSIMGEAFAAKQVYLPYQLAWSTGASRQNSSPADRGFSARSSTTSRALAPARRGGHHQGRSANEYTVGM